MSIRAMQLAKEMGLRPPELIKKLNDAGIAIKSAGMTLTDDQEKKAREALSGKKEKVM